MSVTMKCVTCGEVMCSTVISVSTITKSWSSMGVGGHGSGMGVGGHGSGMSDSSYWSSMSYSHRSVSYSYRCVSYNRSSRVSGVSGVLNDSVESVVGISGVVNSSGGAVGLNQAVVTLNSVAFTRLGLFLHVTGVGIMDSIAELIVSRSLENIYIYNN
jgi:hypothetical protein